MMQIQTITFPTKYQGPFRKIESENKTNAPGTVAVTRTNSNTSNITKDATSNTCTPIVSTLMTMAATAEFI